jgi:hypothetical protein
MIPSIEPVSVIGNSIFRPGVSAVDDPTNLDNEALCTSLEAEYETGRTSLRQIDSHMTASTFALEKYPSKSEIP